jgi:hypothetical protein
MLDSLVYNEEYWWLVATVLMSQEENKISVGGGIKQRKLITRIVIIGDSVRLTTGKEED